MTADTGKIGRCQHQRVALIQCVNSTVNQFCKGICGNYAKQGKRGAKPYTTHVYCSRCGANGVWILREDAPKNRCPCCKMKVRSKSFKQNSGKYNTVVELG
jgi:hypothetical protein